MAFHSMTLCLSHSPGFARDTKEEFGEAFRAGVLRAREAVKRFDPTLVVFFGSDHRRAFTGVVPAISVVHSAEGLGDLLSPTGDYAVPRETARNLTEGLLADGFDVAATHHIALDHGFGLTAADVLGGIDAYPVIPIFINCATPPLGLPGRSVELGRAVGRLLAGLDERILYIGSGGLSHSPPTLALVAEGLSEEERKALSAKHREAAKDLIRPDWDLDFLARLESDDDAWAEALTQADVDPAGVGANEVRTWLAAYAAGGQGLSTVVYEPVREWLTGVGVAMSPPSVPPGAAE